MKIMISFERNEINAIEKKAVEVSKVFGKSEHKIHNAFEVLSAKAYKNFSRGFAGGNATIDYKDNSINLTVTMETRAFRMICDALVKLFMTMWPMIAPFVGLPSAIRAFAKTIKEHCNNAFAAYKAAYVESSVYLISRVKDSDLDLDAVVVTESAKYGNDPRVVCFIHKSRVDCLNDSIIRTLMNNHPTPTIETWEAEEEAIARAHELYNQFRDEDESRTESTMA